MKEAYRFKCMRGIGGGVFFSQRAGFCVCGLECEKIDSTQKCIFFQFSFFRLHCILILPYIKWCYGPAQDFVISDSSRDNSIFCI